MKQWSFSEFSNWLVAIGEQLQQEGLSVEIQREDGERASIRLRAESRVRLGELTVWNDGMAHEAVIDLTSGDFLHERDGFQLDGEWSAQLGGFLEQTLFKGGSPPQ